MKEIKNDTFMIYKELITCIQIFMYIKNNILPEYDHKDILLYLQDFLNSRISYIPQKHLNVH